jgi:hypothetical protein
MSSTTESKRKLTGIRKDLSTGSSYIRMFLETLVQLLGQLMHHYKELNS